MLKYCGEEVSEIISLKRAVSISYERIKTFWKLGTVYFLKPII